MCMIDYSDILVRWSHIWNLWLWLGNGQADRWRKVMHDGLGPWNPVSTFVHVSMTCFGCVEPPTVMLRSPPISLSSSYSARFTIWCLILPLAQGVGCFGFLSAKLFVKKKIIYKNWQYKIGVTRVTISIFNYYYRKHHNLNKLLDKPWHFRLYRCCKRHIFFE